MDQLHGQNFHGGRVLVKYFSPADFAEKFPKTWLIVAGTECSIQKPSQPILQQATFSTYKNKNTAKVLAGCSPGGLVIFCSPAYGGSTSDRQIVKRSPILHMCYPNDSIMADKGSMCRTCLCHLMYLILQEKEQIKW